MSWDAWLTDDRGHEEGAWGYTYNTSPMIYAALDDVGFEFAENERSTWDHLNGMSGPDGAAFLDLIIRGLEADRDRFEAMNPENGWGNYEGLVKVLTEMRNAVPEWPTTWRACG